MDPVVKALDPGQALGDNLRLEGTSSTTSLSPGSIDAQNTRSTRVDLMMPS